MTGVQQVRKQKRFFHRWSHRHPLHRGLVKVANRGLRLVPLSAKYAAMRRVKFKQVPYSLVRPGDHVVQVGAPFDTLHSGRSRGFLLTLAAGSTGSADIVEPHPMSTAQFKTVADSFGLTNTKVHNAAVASSEGTVVLRYDRQHPATNFVDGVARYSDEEKSRFETIEVAGSSLDALVGPDVAIRVLSITTNGAERIALAGASSVLDRTEYVALAGPDRSAYDPILEDLGFEFLSFDDRGITYKRSS